MRRSRHKTVQAVSATVRRCGLIPDGSRVLAAVSGGPDSVALGSILLELSGSRGGAGPQGPAGPGARRARAGAAGGRGRFEVVLGHLNHGLRRTAGRDEAFVRELARQWGVGVVVERADVASEASRRGQGVEEAARSVRYEFLRRAAEQCGADRVALGHHRDDQSETVLMNFLRGSGVRGLSGMPLERPIAPDSGIVVIRPLLEVTREEVMAYLSSRGLESMEDETNRSMAMVRNRVRHKLLPLLERDYAPGLGSRLASLASQMGRLQRHVASEAALAWDEAVWSATSRSVEFRIEVLRGCGPVVCGELILAALEHLGAGRRGIGWEHLESLWRTVSGAVGGQRLELPEGVVGRRRGGRLRLSRGVSGGSQRGCHY